MELNNSLNNIMKNLHNVAIHEAGHAVADCVLGHGLSHKELNSADLQELNSADLTTKGSREWYTPTTQAHVTASLPPSLARLQRIARQGR